MEDGKKYRSVKELANALEVSVNTIKQWEKEGKIPKARRNKFGWRIYTQEEFEEIIKLVKDNNYFKGKD